MHWPKLRVYDAHKSSLYNPEKFQVFDPEAKGLYDLATEKIAPTYPWDPENFETLGELHDFLAEYMGFEPEPDCNQKPFTWNWEKDAPKEAIEALAVL